MSTVSGVNRKIKNLLGVLLRCGENSRGRVWGENAGCEQPEGRVGLGGGGALAPSTNRSECAVQLAWQTVGLAPRPSTMPFITGSLDTPTSCPSDHRWLQRA